MRVSGGFGAVIWLLAMMVAGHAQAQVGAAQVGAAQVGAAQVAAAPVAAAPVAAGPTPAAPPTQSAPAPAEPTRAPPRTSGVSLLGSLPLPPDFKYSPYVNPDAPKGGEVALSTVGTFDSFNPFIVRGTPASDVFQVWDTLMKSNVDESETEYGLLAQTVELAPDG